MVKPIYSPKTLLNQILRDIVLIRRSSGEFFVIQVGANDGVHADPINKYIINFNWSGVLIEPQPEIFERLKENYKTKKNIFFENSAVTDKSGYGDMYKRLSPEKSGLTSLIPDSEFTNRPIYDFRKKSGSQFKFQVKTITFED